MTALYVGIVIVAIAAFVALAYHRDWAWTGFTSGSADEAEGSPTAKTLWDWLKLLIIPVGLAIIAFALNNAASKRDERREDARVASEQAIAADARQEDALRTYVQQMSDLMLRHGLHQQGPRERPASLPPSHVQVVGRTLTLTVLTRLDPERKGVVVRFLSEARLIDDPGAAERVTPISLDNADLRQVSLRGATVSREVSSANPAVPVAFVGPTFSGADLEDGDFRGADLRKASFDDADLRRADFSGANLEGADLSRACVSGARFVATNLNDANFGAQGDHVDLARADVTGADFESALLTHVNAHEMSDSRARFPSDWTSTGLREVAARICPDVKH